jgi:hypothetical protein
MPQLTSDALQELSRIWEKDHPGEQVSYDDLRDLAARLLRIVHVVTVEPASKKR